MCKPKIKITLVDRIGECSCHRGHKIGDTFDYDTDCGKLCPMAVHVAFPYIDILRYVGTPPTSGNGSITPKIGKCYTASDHFAIQRAGFVL